MPLKFLLICLALCPAPAPAAAQEPEVSTAAPARVQSPLLLTISKDSYRSRVGLDYSIRWDFSDLASFRPSLGFLYSGVKAVSGWDITENTRVEYYGFKTNPWRLIISKEKKNGANGGGNDAAPAPAGGVVTSVTPEYRKRVRLSISPLVDDLKRNFDDGLKEFLLRSSLKGLSPEWQKAGDSGRRAFMKDVLSLGVWQVPVPVIKETKQGLEYLSSDKKNPLPKR
jgi:hypothetical protein